MKLVCSQSELNAALQLVSRAVASRPTHPVLANVLLTADAGTDRLSLTGFDLNLGIQTSLAASVETSGAVTLPARLFVEIVSRLSSDSPITLSTDESGEQVELTSLSGSYQMRGMPADDFPDLPLVENGTALKLDPAALVKALRSTLFASSSDEAKQLLTGVHLRFDRTSLEAASTDGHRLAVLSVNDALQAPLEVADPDASDDAALAVTLPARSLREVERLMAGWKGTDAVSLFCERGQVVVLAADQMVTSRTLEGTYPNYRQLFPSRSRAPFSSIAVRLWRRWNALLSWLISTTTWCVSAVIPPKVSCRSVLMPRTSAVVLNRFRPTSTVNRCRSLSTCVTCWMG